MPSSFFAHRNVLITGGCGFIGSNIAHRLVKQGARVSLLARTQAKALNLRGIEEAVEIIDGDIRNKLFLEKAVAGKDDIFHLAGQTSHITSMQQPILDWEINCLGTLNLIEACRDKNQKANIVFAGTVTQIGTPSRLPVDELVCGVPVSIYDAHKAICERYLAIANRCFGLRTTTLRLANVFGQRQQVTDTKRGIVNLMIKRAMLGEPITVYGEGSFIRDYNYVQNIVDAFLLAASSEKTKGEYYVIGSGRGLKFSEAMSKLSEAVNRLCGISAEIQFVPFPQNEARIDSGDFIADSAKFQKATGWKPALSFEEGLEETIRFYQQHLSDYLALAESTAR